MPTEQPIWKCVGHVGDIDPIAYGGGFVYVDETGKYGPEMAWFAPGSDDEWEEKRGETPLQEYRILLEAGDEWWFSKLDQLANFTGNSLGRMQVAAMSDEPMTLAVLYSDLISYFGPHEFDQGPVTRTEDEAYEKYSDEMRVWRNKNVGTA